MADRPIIREPSHMKGVREKTLGGSMFRLDLMTTGLLNEIR